MTYHLNVRWAARDEPLSVCARRLAGMLTALAALHPNLANWRRKADTRAAAFKPFCAMPPSISELESILLRGRHFTSASRELISELGYSTAAWNGLDDRQALSLTLDVGDYSQRLYPNEVDIEGLESGNAVLDSALLKSVLLTIAECWEADWGAVHSWAYKGRAVDTRDKLLLPYGGWLTYLSRPLAERVCPPRDIEAQRTPGGGLFMVVCEEPFDVTNPVHVARLDAVQAALGPIQKPL